MKKVNQNRTSIAIFACAVILISVVSGFFTYKPETPVVYINGTTQPHEQESGNINQKVTIEIPMILLSSEYQKNLQAYAEDYGYENVKSTNGGTKVKMTMKALSHDLLLTKVGISIINNIYDNFDTNYKYAKKMTEYYSDFSNVVISIDTKMTDDTTDFDDLGEMVAESCFMYQFYQVKASGKCTVKLVDSESGDEIFVHEYKLDEIGR